MQPPGMIGQPHPMAPDQIPTSAIIGGSQTGPNPFFATGPSHPAAGGLGQPYIIGDPTMPGHHQMPRPGGVQGNLVGPNSAIFQGGRGGGIGPLGPMGPPGGLGFGGPAGGFDPGAMSPDMMLH